MLIGHNLKHDIEWSLACGIPEVLDKKIWDTILAEYVLSRGRKRPLSLKEVGQRRALKHQKLDIEFGTGDVDKILWEDLVKYGIVDILTTTELFEDQFDDFLQAKNNSLLKQFKMMCDFLPVLVSMRREGLKIDMDELLKIRKEYEYESAILERDMQEIIKDVVGATPININSTDDMSMLFYSFCIVDKADWTKTFNIGYEERGAGKKPKPLTRMSASALAEVVTRKTKPIYKCVAGECRDCGGKGYIHRIKKDGKPFKLCTTCRRCEGRGFELFETKDRGGFRYKPYSYRYASESGFSTDKEALRLLKAENPDNVIGNAFIDKYMRYNAIRTYKDTFVDGILNHVVDGIIHPDLLQYVTSTGRLAGRDPNFQNLPRGTTAPVKRAIISRFDGGKIIEADFAQLEFRTAGELAGDVKILEDVLNKVDIHSFTAGIIGCSRQDAKPHTFKPLYGGKSGTDKEKAYYTAFLEKYADTKAWHERLKSEAIATGKIKLIQSGMEFAFPTTKRLASGYVIGETNIVNYPVQYFATGVITPLACIAIWKEFRKLGLTSKLILTVHDSIVADVFPGEEQIVVDIMNENMINIKGMIQKYFKYDFKFPLDCEIKISKTNNWLETKIYE